MIISTHFARSVHNDVNAWRLTTTTTLLIAEVFFKCKVTSPATVPGKKYRGKFVGEGACDVFRVSETSVCGFGFSVYT